MSDPAVAAAFAEHGSWVTRFSIDGCEYGGSFDVRNDPRPDAFRTAFPEAATILELGSLEGGHTFELARRPGVTSVVALEGRRANLARAQTAARLLKAGNVRFIHADLETVALQQFGKFDAIFCSGLLYHLPAPWKLLRQFKKVSSHAFLWTHYCKEEGANTVMEGYKGTMKGESGLDEPLSGLSPHSFWPTLGSLVEMLKDAEFPMLDILHNEEDHRDGPAVMIVASAARD